MSCFPMLFLVMMANGGRLDIKRSALNQEQVSELNVIFRTGEMSNKKKRVLVWDSALETFEVGGYQIIPLTSSRALHQEGRMMENCVGGYDERCAKGLARVFSIRDQRGDRVATVALVFGEDQWYLEQIRGVSNSDVCYWEEEYFDYEIEQALMRMDMTDLHYVAHEVARCYRQACGKKGC